MADSEVGIVVRMDNGRVYDASRQQSESKRQRALVSLPSKISSGSSSKTEPLKTLAPIAQQSDSDSFYQIEEIVKKSRFIGIAVPATSWDDAKIILEQVRKDHPTL